MNVATLACSPAVGVHWLLSMLHREAHMWSSTAKAHALPQLQTNYPALRRQSPRTGGVRPVGEVVRAKHPWIVRRGGYADKYASDQAAFFADYALAHAKLSELGVEWEEGGPVCGSAPRTCNSVTGL